MNETITGIARRVKFHEAKRAFQAGGTILVSEHGHEESRPVTSMTTTHTKASIAWEDLVRMVREWRGRYPNQRFYVVDQT